MTISSISMLLTSQPVDMGKYEMFDIPYLPMREVPKTANIWV